MADGVGHTLSSGPASASSRARGRGDAASFTDEERERERERESALWQHPYRATPAIRVQTKARVDYRSRTLQSSLGGGGGGGEIVQNLARSSAALKRCGGRRHVGHSASEGAAGTRANARVPTLPTPPPPCPKKVAAAAAASAATEGEGN